MPVSELHREVAAIALRAASQHGFALGGGNALIAHGVIDRASEPVIMDFGPVLDLEDAIGGKVCALATRAVPRDYLDTAAALERYPVADLIGFARRLDPGLTDEDFADAGRRLDQVGDGWCA